VDKMLLGPDIWPLREKAIHETLDEALDAVLLAISLDGSSFLGFNRGNINCNHSARALMAWRKTGQS